MWGTIGIDEFAWFDFDFAVHPHACAHGIWLWVLMMMVMTMVCKEMGLLTCGKRIYLVK